MPATTPPNLRGSHHLANTPLYPIAQAVLLTASKDSGVKFRKLKGAVVEAISHSELFFWVIQFKELMGLSLFAPKSSSPV